MGPGLDVPKGQPSCTWPPACVLALSSPLLLSRKAQPVAPTEPRRPSAFPPQVGLQPAPALRFPSLPQVWLLAICNLSFSTARLLSPPKGSPSELWSGWGPEGSQKSGQPDRPAPTHSSENRSQLHCSGAWKQQLAQLVAGEGSGVLVCHAAETYSKIWPDKGFN